MSAMLSRYLKDFSDIKPVAPMVENDVLGGDLFGFADIADEPPVDLEAERRDASSEGRAAATAELTEKHAIELQTLELVHQRELEEMKTRYDAEIAAVFAARLVQIAAEVADLVSTATARAIAPVLTEEVAERAVVSLAALLREQLTDGVAAQIIVKGPHQLFALLHAELGEKAEMLRHQETDDVDLAVEVDGSVLVTRISAWSTSLKKVLE